MPELLELCAKLQKLEPEMYPIAVRGTRSWATIHPGFLSAFNGYDAKDYDQKVRAQSLDILHLV